MFAKLFVTLVVLAAVLCSEAQAAKPTVNLCVIPQNGTFSTLVLHHTVFAKTYYASSYPEINFELTVLTKKQNSDSRSMITAVLQTDVKCDGFIGPTTSSSCTRLAPYITQPWLSETASSTALSDKFQFPYFSRTIPSDAAGGLAVALLASSMGFTKMNTVGVDEPYSRSVIGAFTQNFAAQGGTVVKHVTIPEVATVNEVTNAFQEVVDSDVYITLIITNNEDKMQRVMNEAAKATGINTKHVIFSSEAWCSASNLNNLHGNWSGLFCITYDTMKEVTDKYTKAWQADGTATTQFLTQYNGSLGLNEEYAHPSSSNASSHSINFFTDPPSSFESLGVDSMHLMMQAFHNAYKKNATFVPSNADDMLLHLRNTSIDGLTGDIKLTEEGDREGGVVLFHNLQPDPQNEGKVKLVKIGSTAAGVLDADIAFESLSNGYWWKGKYFSDEAPEQEKPPPGDTTQITIIIGVFVGVFVLLVVIFMLYRFKKNNPKLVKELVASGLWGAIGFIFLLILDLGTDVYSCFLVYSTDNGSTNFQHAFIGLVSIGGLCSIVEMTTFVRAFAATVQVHRTTELSEQRELATRAAKLNFQEAVVSTISLIVQHIPLFVMSMIAIENGTHFMFVASAILSAIVVGYKLQTAGLVWEKISQKSYDPEALSSVTQGVVFNSETDHGILKATRMAYALKYPDRNRGVTEGVRRAIESLKWDGVTSSEFFAVILPYVVETYEERSRDEAKKRSEESGLAIGVGPDAPNPMAKRLSASYGEGEASGLSSDRAVSAGYTNKNASVSENENSQSKSSKTVDIVTENSITNANVNNDDQSLRNERKSVTVAADADEWDVDDMEDDHDNNKQNSGDVGSMGGGI